MWHIAARSAARATSAASAGLETHLVGPETSASPASPSCACRTSCRTIWHAATMPFASVLSASAMYPVAARVGYRAGTICQFYAERRLAEIPNPFICRPNCIWLLCTNCGTRRDGCVEHQSSQDCIHWQADGYQTVDGPRVGQSYLDRPRGRGRPRDHATCSGHTSATAAC